jgi:uncharacterized lipoprotein YbaY
MRALMFAVSLALLTLAGCGQQSAPTPAASTAGPAAGGPPPVPAGTPAVRGSVLIEGLTDLPAKLQLRLRLLDVSDPSIAPPVIAERLEPAPAKVPYSYALPFEQARIAPDRRYAIESSLLASGAILYGTPAPVSVLTQGAGRQVNLTLVRGSLSAADAAPADLLKQAFDALEASIGGMERLTGERIDANVTIGWDGFADGDDVRFARENVDYGDAGSASLRYGYRSGQPWVIAREQKGVLSLVGWGDSGEVLLNRHAEGEQMDEAQIAELRSKSERLYMIVKASADRE